MTEYVHKVQYYETDKMSIVHHSNYIRFLEEARCHWLEQVGMPFSLLEEKGITIPVLGVNVTYKYHVTFDDTIQIQSRKPQALPEVFLSAERLKTRRNRL